MSPALLDFDAEVTLVGDTCSTCRRPCAGSPRFRQGRDSCPSAGTPKLVPIFETARRLLPTASRHHNLPVNMSSRFFRGDSDSESSSEEEEELYGSQGERSEEEESEEDEDEDADEDDDSSSEDDAKGKGASWFLRGDADDSDDSDDEDRERVVKSAKDKRLDELEGTIKLIDNAEKIGDWAVINAGMYRRRTERAQADGLQNLTR
jgi:hypothetical protein